MKVNVEGTDNYTSGSTTLDFEIYKKEIWTCDVSKEYDGTNTLRKLITNSTIVSGDEVGIAVTFTNVYAGTSTYETALLYGEDSSNYSLLSSGLSANITARSIKNASYSLPYTGDTTFIFDAGALTTGNVLSTDAGKFRIMVEVEVPEAGAANVLNVNLLDTFSSNYSLSVEDISFTITKSTPTLSISETYNIGKTSYDGLAVNPLTAGDCITNSDGEISFGYKLASETKYSTTLPVYAGVYDFKISVAETASYTYREVVEQFTISKREVTSTIHIYTTYNGLDRHSTSDVIIDDESDNFIIANDIIHQTGELIKENMLLASFTCPNKNAMSRVSSTTLGANSFSFSGPAANSYDFENATIVFSVKPIEINIPAKNCIFTKVYDKTDYILYTPNEVITGDDFKVKLYLTTNDVDASYDPVQGYEEIGTDRYEGTGNYHLISFLGPISATITPKNVDLVSMSVPYFGNYSANYTLTTLDGIFEGDEGFVSLTNFTIDGVNYITSPGSYQSVSSTGTCSNKNYAVSSIDIFDLEITKATSFISIDVPYEVFINESPVIGTDIILNYPLWASENTVINLQYKSSGVWENVEGNLIEAQGTYRISIVITEDPTNYYGSSYTSSEFYFLPSSAFDSVSQFNLNDGPNEYVYHYYLTAGEYSVAKVNIADARYEYICGAYSTPVNTAAYVYTGDGTLLFSRDESMNGGTFTVPADNTTIYVFIKVSATRDFTVIVYPYE